MWDLDSHHISGRWAERTSEALCSSTDTLEHQGIHVSTGLSKFKRSSEENPFVFGLSK